MWNKVQKLLLYYQVAEGPLLLGYSGGVDSTALLAFLGKSKVDVHVLHVNHGWRSTSLKEAEELRRQVEACNLPFYLETITHINPLLEKNLEDRYRQERLRIFQKYYKQIGAKALLLAHQKDDQAETVFKRIFEGASLGKLSGLKEYSEFKGMKVLRPMLDFTKEELYRFLEQEQLSFIEDETNKNSDYLRARQREEIFPLIEGKFGKSAKDNLCRLSQNLSRYESYMDRKVERYYKEMVKGPLGIYLNLKKLDSLEDLELEYFIRKISEQYGCSISYEALATLINKVKDGSSDKKVLLQKGAWIVDRGYLFFLTFLPIKSAINTTLIPKLPYEFNHQGLKWILEEVNELKREASWQDLWNGSIEFKGTDECFKMTASDSSYSVNHRSVRDVYLEKKIPVFLRTLFPYIFQGEELRSTFLTSISPPSFIGTKVFRLSVIGPIIRDKKE